MDFAQQTMAQPASATNESQAVELLKFPYPYQAGFTVASDIDSASVIRFRAVHGLFCQTETIRQHSAEWRALGLSTDSAFYSAEQDGVQGLGLPLADSFFLVRDPTTFGMYRQHSPQGQFVEDEEEGVNCANLLREWLKEGLVDSFHAFLHYKRREVEPLLSAFYGWCEEEGVPKPSVWINHSAGVTPTGLCPGRLQPNSIRRFARWAGRRTVGPLLGRSPIPWRQVFTSYEGATPGSPYYINDLLAANGLKFVWLNTADLHCNRAALPEERWRDRSTILRQVTMDDGKRYYQFERCYGRTAEGAGGQSYLRNSPLGCDASSLVTEENLEELCAHQGTCILYTHWTHHRSMPIGDETIRRFELLRQWHRCGKLWVAPTAKLLEWTRLRTFLDYTCSRQDDTLQIEICGVDDPLFGYERLGPQAAAGLCFRARSNPKSVRVVLDGRVLDATQVCRDGDRVWLATGNLDHCLAEACVRS